MRPFSRNEGSRTGLHLERGVTPPPVPVPHCVSRALEPSRCPRRRLETSLEIQNFPREKARGC